MKIEIESGETITREEYTKRLHNKIGHLEAKITKARAKHNRLIKLLDSVIDQAEAQLKVGDRYATHNSVFIKLLKEETNKERS